MVHIPLIHCWRRATEFKPLRGARGCWAEGHLRATPARTLTSVITVSSKKQRHFLLLRILLRKTYAIEQGNKKSSIYSHQQYKNLLKSCISKSGLRQTLTTCPNLKYFIEICESHILLLFAMYVLSVKYEIFVQNHMFSPIYSQCETSLGQGVKHVRHDMTDTGYAPVSLNADYLWLNPAEGLCRLTVFVSSGQVKSDQ